MPLHRDALARHLRAWRLLPIFALVIVGMPASPLSARDPETSIEALPAYAQPALEAEALRSLRDGYALLVRPDAAVAELVSTVGERGVRFTGADRRRDIERFRLGNLQYGLRFIRTDVKLLDSKVEMRGETLVLTATEDLVMYYVVGNRPHGPNDWQGQRLRHEFRFERKGSGGWSLTHDNALWGSQGRESKPTGDGKPADGSKPLAESAPELQFGASARVRPAAAAVGAASGTYNASAASSYAQTYVYTYNSAYQDITDFDCTNFVSQALRAGGWVDAGGFWWDYYAWWYNLSNHSRTDTWVVAANLRNHVAYSGRGYSLSAFTDLIVGDVMFADWWYASDPDIDHSMLVTQKFSNNYADIKFTYHDTDRLNYSLASILASNPTSSNLYYGMRIQYTNP